MTTKDRVKLLTNSNPDFVIYWHHLKTHQNPFTEGYIGIAKVSKYGSRFCGSLSARYNRCTHFQKAIEKYKEENIITTILHEGLSIDEANKMEKHYRKTPVIGWNVRQGGGNKGFLSEESKSKISKTKKGTNHLYYDKIFTPEAKEKIRQSKLGNKNMVGKKLSEEWKRNIGLANKGKPRHKNTLKARYKKVVCEETGVVYSSQIEAEKDTGVSRKLISNCCIYPKRKTAGGFHWKFYTEETGDERA